MLLVRAAVLRWASQGWYAHNLHVLLVARNALLAAASHEAAPLLAVWQVAHAGRAAVGPHTCARPPSCRAAGEEPDPADAAEPVQEGRRGGVDGGPPRVSYDIRRSLGERCGSASGAKSTKLLLSPVAYGDRQHAVEDGADDAY